MGNTSDKEIAHVPQKQMIRESFNEVDDQTIWFEQRLWMELIRKRIKNLRNEIKMPSQGKSKPIFFFIDMFYSDDQINQMGKQQRESFIMNPILSKLFFKGQNNCRLVCGKYNIEQFYEIQIDGIYIDFTDISFSSLQQFLKVQSEEIQQLFLQNFPFDDSDQLNQLQNTIAQFQNLQKFGLQNLSWMQSNIQSIASIISSLTQLTHLNINLVSNDLKNFEQLAQAIAIHKNLTHLDLNLNNSQLNQKDIEYLRGHISGLGQLVYLDLNLGNNKIQQKCAFNVGELIQKLTSLQFMELKLQNTFLNVKEAEFLKLGIQQLTELTHFELVLNNSNLGETGSNHLALGISKLLKLTHLDLQMKSNNLLDKGAKNIGAGIKYLKNLTFLIIDLASNFIGFRGIKDFGHFVSQSNKISFVSINLGYNKIEKRVKYENLFKILNVKYSALDTIRINVENFEEIKRDQFVSLIKYSRKLIQKELKEPNIQGKTLKQFLNNSKIFSKHKKIKY